MSTVNTGKVDATGAMRLRIQAEPDVYAGVDRIGRQCAFRPRARPTMRATSRLACAARQGADLPTPARRTAATGSTASSRSTTRGLSFDEFLFETGPLDNPYTADGKGFVELGDEPRFAMTVGRRAGALRRGDRRRRLGRQPDAGAAPRGDCRRRWLDLPKPDRYPAPSRSTCRPSWPATRRSATCACRPSRHATAGR